MTYLPRFRDLRLAVAALQAKCTSLRAHLEEKRKELRTVQAALKKPFDRSLEAPVQQAEQRVAKSERAYQTDCEAVQSLTTKLEEIRHLREQTRTHRATLVECIAALRVATEEDAPTASRQDQHRSVRRSDLLR